MDTFMAGHTFQTPGGTKKLIDIRGEYALLGDSPEERAPAHQFLLRIPERGLLHVPQDCGQCRAKREVT